MRPSWSADLGQTGGRDPDALPPHTPLEWLMNFIHREVQLLGRGNAIFAMKAGLLTS